MKKNHVKSVREVETSIKYGKAVTIDNSFQRFDSDANVIESINYNDEGKIKSHQTTVYNKNGDKTEEVIFNPDGKIKKKKIYKYNSTNDKIEEAQFDPSGVLTEKTSTAYNANGEKITSSVNSRFSRWTIRSRAQVNS